MLTLSKITDIAKATARGGFFLFFGNMSSTVILAISSILVARLLGPENYGLYAVAFVVPQLLIAFSDFGISPALVRFSASLRAEGEHRKAAGLIRTGTIFKIILSVVLASALLLLSDEIAIHILKRPSAGLLIRFTSLLLVGQVVLTTPNSAFIGLDKTENSSLLMNVNAVTRAVLSPMLIILGLGTIGAILGAGTAAILAASFGTAVPLLRTIPALYSKSQGENVAFFQGLRLMVSYGRFLYISSVLLSFLAQYQTLILVFFVSYGEIGNYTTAMNFSVLMTLLTYPITTSLFPAFSKLDIVKDRDLVDRMFRFSVKYVALLVLPASMALAVLSKDAVSTLYGSQYQLAPSYLTLYTLSFLCAGWGMLVVGNLFNSQGDTKSTFKIGLVGLAISAPLSLVLTVLYGVTGLIASGLTSSFLSTVYGLSLVHRRYAINIDWNSSLRIGLASFTSALLVYIFLTFVPIHTSILRLATGGALYLFLFLTSAPLLGAIEKLDIDNLDTLVKGIPLIYPAAKLILDFEKKILDLSSKL